MSMLSVRIGVIVAIGVAVILPGAAFAHPGHGSGFAEGFAHPFGGLDHLLAALAVGMIAANLGGRALLAVPGAFLTAMALGGMLGAGGVAIPATEVAIAASLLAFGLAVACHFDAPPMLAAALVAFFAIFHGHAHGSEMAADASRVHFAVGFLMATAALHAAGIVIGKVALRKAPRLIPLGGGIISLSGVVLLLAMA